MIAIPERYKEEMSIAEALDIVLCEDENLLNCMETIKQTSEVKILSMSDMLTYNAYNVVFKGMSKLF
mgnify:FL=1